MRGAKLTDQIATVVLWGAALLVVVILVFLLGHILWAGLPVLTWNFLSRPPQALLAGGGVSVPLLNSIYLLVLALLIAVPIGLAGGVYLAEWARPGRTTDTIRAATDVLASVPSIVVGLFALALFVDAFGFGPSKIAGALGLTVISLPLLVRVTEEALRQIPDDLREASYALGTSKTQTILFVVIPAALTQIVTGIILAAGRILGETAVLVFVTGLSSNRFSLDPFSSGVTLSVHLWFTNAENILPDATRIANGTAALLVLIMLALYLTGLILTARSKRFRAR